MEDQWLVRRNIAHFRQLLETETDERKRSVLMRLVAEFEAKLVPALATPTDATSGATDCAPAGSGRRSIGATRVLDDVRHHGCDGDCVLLSPSTSAHRERTTEGGIT